MRALRLYAGPRALEHIRRHGLLAHHVGAIPAAAGGPKGLVLLALDRFLFGDWLAQAPQPIDLIGASIGAWRMATACLSDPVAAFEQLEHEYVHQHYELPPGRKRPSPEQVSAAFAQNLRRFYGGRIDEVLQHPRWRLHIVTSRGRHLLAREGHFRTPLGYLGAYATNAMSRAALGAWLERVVFSREGTPLPFDTRDLRTRQVALKPDNFMDALQASCSIPFVLRSVPSISGAPPGTYWDGGITDYHLHLHYRPAASSPVVLYPHFQRAVVPGWLDKVWKQRHRSTSALDDMLVLAPDPQWVGSLPHGKLPDRSDFTRHGADWRSRAREWGQAVQASQQLAEEFADWLRRPDVGRVEPL